MFAERSMNIDDIFGVRNSVVKYSSSTLTACRGRLSAITAWTIAKSFRLVKV